MQLAHQLARVGMGTADDDRTVGLQHDVAREVRTVVDVGRQEPSGSETAIERAVRLEARDQEVFVSWLIACDHDSAIGSQGTANARPTMLLIALPLTPKDSSNWPFVS